jgi:hypothetical protein
VLRAIDAAGGRADLIGELLADQVQGHKHIITTFSTNGQSAAGRIASGSGFVSTAVNSDNVFAGDVATDGVNGTPRTGNVTADKSITVGVPYMVICVPA